MGMKVPVNIEVYEEDGAEYILPAVKDIDKLRSVMQKELDEADRLLSSDATKGQGEAKKLVAGYLQRDVDALEEIRKKYGPHADQRSYTLIKPGWGKWQQAVAEAKVADENGNTSLSQERLMLDLLPGAVEGMSSAEVTNLSPNIGQYLWNKLYASCSPDSTRLPF